MSSVFNLKHYCDKKTPEIIVCSVTAKLMAVCLLHPTSVVTDSEFASESANFSSVRPSPSPRIFGGRK